MRARNIKPAFFLNEDLAVLSPHCRLFFIGLWCVSDREGRSEVRVKWLQAQIFPHEPHVKVQKYISDLEKANFIKTYEVNGKYYIQIINFTKHQNPHIKEAKSIIPPYKAPEIPVQAPEIPVQAPEKPERAEEKMPESLLLIPDTRNPDSFLDRSKESRLLNTLETHEENKAGKSEEHTTDFITIKATEFESFQVPKNEYENLVLHTGSKKKADYYFKSVYLNRKKNMGDTKNLLYAAVEWYERDVRDGKEKSFKESKKQKEKIAQCNQCHRKFSASLVDYPKGVCLECHKKNLQM